MIQYKILEGDTLEIIADKFNVTVLEILNANKDLEYMSIIYAGQFINIPIDEIKDIDKPKKAFKIFSDKEMYELMGVEIDNTYIKGTKVLCLEDIRREQERRKIKKIRISVFFDGTGNNRANTKYKDKHPHLLTFKEYAQYPSGFDSYDNDYSNVSRLEEYIIKDSSYDLSTSLYIEGIGTTNENADNLRGMTTGRKSILYTSSGIKDKTNKGIEEIKKIIDATFRSNRNNTRLQIDIDVFGFSRGAAAARYFVYLVLNSDSRLSDELSDKGYWVSSVKIKFAGLFDTVAAYGVMKNSDSNLHLGFSINKPEKVVQLAAAEEYRDSFPLTNIDSAGCNGVELFLPGCHSDIGGGYHDGVKEESHQLLDLYMFTGEKKWLEEDKQELCDLGWYKKDEFQLIDLGFRELIADRTIDYKSYSYIPLRIMAKFAQDAGVPIDYDSIHTDYELYAGEKTKINSSHKMHKLEVMINEYVNKHGNYGLRTSKYSDWHLNKNPILKNVRHDYFHFSARYGDSGGAHKPRLVNGRHRKRAVK